MQDLQHHGKTDLGVELAKQISGEIVSADSIQIYKYMNIGSAKPTKEEMQGVRHHLIDFVEPDRRYSVADYKREAIRNIEEIRKREKTPIIVGGTGLYINSLIYGIDYPEIQFDEEYRKKLEIIVKQEGLQKLYEEAKKIDEKATKNISPNDQKRIIRILEIYKETGKTKTQMEEESRKNKPEYNYKLFVIDMPREKLYQNINQRVDKMIRQGLIEEVKEITERYKECPTSMQGLGYKETKEYLDGIITKEEMIEKIKLQTRHYAKRQLTWFRKNKEAIWISGTKEEKLKKILEVI